MNVLRESSSDKQQVRASLLLSLRRDALGVAPAIVFSGLLNGG